MLLSQTSRLTHSWCAHKLEMSLADCRQLYGIDNKQDWRKSRNSNWAQLSMGFKANGLCYRYVTCRPHMKSHVTAIAGFLQTLEADSSPPQPHTSIEPSQSALIGLIVIKGDS